MLSSLLADGAAYYDQSGTMSTTVVMDARPTPLRRWLDAKTGRFTNVNGKTNAYGVEMTAIDNDATVLLSTSCTCRRL